MSEGKIGLSFEELALVFSLMGYPQRAHELLLAHLNPLEPEEADARLHAAGHSLIARGLLSLDDEGQMRLDETLQKLTRGLVDCEFTIRFVNEKTLAQVDQRTFVVFLVAVNLVGIDDEYIGIFRYIIKYSIGLATIQRGYYQINTAQPVAWCDEVNIDESRAIRFEYNATGVGITQVNTKTSLPPGWKILLQFNRICIGDGTSIYKPFAS